MNNRLDWAEDDDGRGWNSGSGRYRIVRLDDCFGEGSYFRLCWLGTYGQTCCREYGTLGDARRAAAMRGKTTEVAA